MPGADSYKSLGKKLGYANGRDNEYSSKMTLNEQTRNGNRLDAMYQSQGATTRGVRTYRHPTLPDEEKHETLFGSGDGGHKKLRHKNAKMTARAEALPELASARGAHVENPTLKLLAKQGQYQTKLPHVSQEREQ